MFGRINDLVRSTIVCRHINEPAKIAAQIVEFAGAEGLVATSTAQTKEEGYYAYHVYVAMPVSLMDASWNRFDQDVLLEIQITTEMQHMLYELTHSFYDKERHNDSTDRNSWKWDYRSARFSASYLSHTLHLLEGLILQLHEEIEGGAPAQPADQAANREPAPNELQISRPTPESASDEAPSDFVRLMRQGEIKQALCWRASHIFEALHSIDVGHALKFNG